MLTETVPEPTADQPAPAEKKEDKGSALWREIKGLLWVLLAVLAFHSFIAKPFYIPSESMMPGLLTGGAKARLDALAPEGHAIDIHLTMTDDHPWAQAVIILSARKLEP